MPTEDVNIRLNNAYCDITNMVATESEITCTLTSLPAAGSWNIEVFDLKGLIPVDPSTALIEVDLVIDSVTPNTQLNQLGGDILHLIGTGFDQNFENTELLFPDGTTCDIFKAGDTYAKCVVAGFDPTALDTSNAYTITATVNSKTNSDHSVMILDTKQSG